MIPSNSSISSGQIDSRVHTPTSKANSRLSKSDWPRYVMITYLTHHVHWWCCVRRVSVFSSLRFTSSSISKISRSPIVWPPTFISNYPPIFALDLKVLARLSHICLSCTMPYYQPSTNEPCLLIMSRFALKRSTLLLDLWKAFSFHSGHPFSVACMTPKASLTFKMPWNSTVISLLFVVYYYLFTQLLLTNLTFSHFRLQPRTPAALRFSNSLWSMTLSILFGLP